MNFDLFSTNLYSIAEKAGLIAQLDGTQNQEFIEKINGKVKPNHRYAASLDMNMVKKEIQTLNLKTLRRKKPNMGKPHKLAPIKTRRNMVSGSHVPSPDKAPV